MQLHNQALEQAVVLVPRPCTHRSVLSMLLVRRWVPSGDSRMPVMLSEWPDRLIVTCALPQQRVGENVRRGRLGEGLEQARGEGLKKRTQRDANRQPDISSDLRCQSSNLWLAQSLPPAPAPLPPP